MNTEQWRARVPVVTVKELCPCCNLLKEGVKRREAINVAMYSCEPCFIRKKESVATVKDDDYYAW